MEAGEEEMTADVVYAFSCTYLLFCSISLQCAEGFVVYGRRAVVLSCPKLQGF
jgi:hypothetical protein